MVAPWMLCNHARVDEGESVIKHRRACRGSVVRGMAKVFKTFLAMGCEAAGKLLLLIGEHVDDKGLALANKWQRIACQIHTDQDKRRVERDRAECIDRQPPQRSLAVRGDNSNSGGKVAHYLPEKIFFNRHLSVL